MGQRPSLLERSVLPFQPTRSINRCSPPERQCGYSYRAPTIGCNTVEHIRWVLSSEYAHPTKLLSLSFRFCTRRNQKPKRYPTCAVSQRILDSLWGSKNIIHYRTVMTPGIIQKFIAGWNAE